MRGAAHHDALRGDNGVLFTRCFRGFASARARPLGADTKQLPRIVLQLANLFGASRVAIRQLLQKSVHLYGVRSLGQGVSSARMITYPPPFDTRKAATGMIIALEPG